MTDKALSNLVEPEVVVMTSKYLRRLIIESPYIRARLYNPGGSILLLATSNPEQVSYGAQIGNDAHLDLVEAEQVLERDFSKGERELLARWAHGFTSAQAAEYSHTKGPIIRKRRQRVVEKLEDVLNGRSRATSDGDAPVGGPREGHQPEEPRNSGRAKTEVNS